MGLAHLRQSWCSNSGLGIIYVVVIYKEAFESICLQICLVMKVWTVSSVTGSALSRYTTLPSYCTNLFFLSQVTEVPSGCLSTGGTLLPHNCTAWDRSGVTQLGDIVWSSGSPSNTASRLCLCLLLSQRAFLCPAPSSPSSLFFPTQAASHSIEKVASSSPQAMLF